MQLLNELLELRAQRTLDLLEAQAQAELEALLEDLGNLKRAALGRMVNSFKQSYRFDDNGRSSSYTGPRASEVGKKFASRGIPVGPDSEVIDIKGSVKNWNFVKKAIRDNSAAKTGKPNPAAVVLYIDGKAVTLLIMDPETITSVKNVAGVSWDFTGILADDEIKGMIGSMDYNSKFAPDGPHYDTVSQHKPSAKSSEVKRHEKQNYRDDKGVVRHYNGIGVQIRDVGPFVERLVAEFNTRLTMKVITSDVKSKEVRDKRKENKPISRDDLQLFQDDLQKRLAKYKLAKTPTAETLDDLVQKIFDKEIKKVRWQGEVYLAKTDRTWESNAGDLEKLLRGATVRIAYEGDTSVERYNHKKLYLWIKLDGMQIKPVKVTYYVGSEQKTETFN